MENFLIWAITGAVIGVLATLIMRRRHPILLLNVILGSIGAVVAGYWIPRLLDINDTSSAWLGLLVAAGGAIILLGIVNYFGREHNMKNLAIEGHWDKVSAKIRSRWPKITQEESDQIHGDHHNELINLIVERYGIPEKEAEDQLQRYLTAILPGVS